MLRVVSRTAVLVTALLALAACGASDVSSPGPKETAPTSLASTPSGPRASGPSRHVFTHPTHPSMPTFGGSSAPSGVSKLLVFVVENHSLSEMRSQMPWTYALAQHYGYATAYHAMTHPSLPNYLAIAGGSTFGVTDDNDPSSHPLPAPSVFGAALAAGRTARVYADAMPTPCDTSSAGEYYVRHNPWTYFPSERPSCLKYDTSMARYAGDVRSGNLPDAGMVVPDGCHDAHDCSLATADAWLRDQVGLAMSGPDFRSGRLAIVVTADEDDGSQGNTVLTVVVHPSLHGFVTGAPLSQLSLSRLYSEVLGLPPLRDAATAPSMAAAFHLPLAHG